MVKNLPAIAGDSGSTPGSGRSAGEGIGYPLWYSWASLVAQRVNNLSEQLCLPFQSCLTLCHSVDCSPPGSSVHRDSPGNNIEVGCHALLQAIFLQIELGSPALQVNSLPSEPPGKHKNTGVGR